MDALMCAMGAPWSGRHCVMDAAYAMGMLWEMWLGRATNLLLMRRVLLLRVRYVRATYAMCMG